MGARRAPQPRVVVGVALGVEDDPVGLEPEPVVAVAVDLLGDVRAREVAVQVVGPRR